MNVSIVIPVYNKEQYITSCMESLLRQDFDDFEIVAVDDGSTDGSGAACDRMAATDSRIHVFHTPNQGVTAARRYGVEQAKGRYILFVDSDDELKGGALRALYDTIEETGADEVMGTYRTQHGRLHDSGRRGWQPVAPLINDLLATRNSFCVLWGIIFRRELLEGCLTTPREVIEREDILMQIKCLMKHPKVYFTSHEVYLYNEGLPNSRRTGLDRIIVYERELRQTLQPEWATYRRGFLLHRIKTYEMFLERQQFDVFDAYYKDLRRENLSGLPLADRLVVALPPRLAYWPVHLYKKLSLHR